MHSTFKIASKFLTQQVKMLASVENIPFLLSGLMYGYSNYGGIVPNYITYSVQSLVCASLGYKAYSCYDSYKMSKNEFERMKKEDNLSDPDIKNMIIGMLFTMVTVMLVQETMNYMLLTYIGEIVYYAYSHINLW